MAMIWGFLDYDRYFVELGKMVVSRILVHMDTRERLVERLKL